MQLCNLSVNHIMQLMITLYHYCESLFIYMKMQCKNYTQLLKGFPKEKEALFL